MQAWHKGRSEVNVGVGSVAQDQVVVAAALVDGAGAGADGSPWVLSRKGREGSRVVVVEVQGEAGPARRDHPGGSLDPVDSVAPWGMVAPPGGA